eukprot:TRINITY_DN51507_c0_g1_i1.p1 TRINITY_DN51507_c0_g1~~TRINITY_DN51507_c0_g1_i1.p1  ORF type:complete len:405 (+),score=78.47 TRINITY_DN51507_c0_g1_i1:388-1602(+)
MPHGLSTCFCLPDLRLKGPWSAAGLRKFQKLDVLKALPVSEIKRREAWSEALRSAVEEGERGRDRMVGSEALVTYWREVCKPRKGGSIATKPPGSKLDFPDLFEQWLEQRGLGSYLEREEDQKGWYVYKYTKEPVIESDDTWETAWHGTWWYALWSVLHTGVFLESNNRALGHDYWMPGVYCSPEIDTGLWYARPHVLFGDDVYHRLVFEVRVDPERIIKNRQRGGVQWVFPLEAVALHKVWVRSNAPPSAGEERIKEWHPRLEARPDDALCQEPLVNPRQGQWEDHEDAFEWEGNTGAPPWAGGRSSKEQDPTKETPEEDSRETAEPSPSAKSGGSSAIKRAAENDTAWPKKQKKNKSQASWDDGSGAADSWNDASWSQWDQSPQSAMMRLGVLAAMMGYGRY